MNALQETMRKRPLNVAEYHLMGEVGIFAPVDRVELIEGEYSDIANAQITIHRDAGEEGYSSEFKPDDWLRVTPLPISDVVVDLSELF